MCRDFHISFQLLWHILNVLHCFFRGTMGLMCCYTPCSFRLRARRTRTPWWGTRMPSRRGFTSSNSRGSCKPMKQPHIEKLRKRINRAWRWSNRNKKKKKKKLLLCLRCFLNSVRFFSAAFFSSKFCFLRCQFNTLEFLGVRWVCISPEKARPRVMM